MPATPLLQPTPPPAPAIETYTPGDSAGEILAVADRRRLWDRMYTGLAFQDDSLGPFEIRLPTIVDLKNVIRWDPHTSVVYLDHNFTGRDIIVVWQDERESPRGKGKTLLLSLKPGLTTGTAPEYQIRELHLAWVEMLSWYRGLLNGKEVMLAHYLANALRMRLMSEINHESTEIAQDFSGATALDKEAPEAAARIQRFRNQHAAAKTLLHQRLFLAGVSADVKEILDAWITDCVSRQDFSVLDRFDFVLIGETAWQARLDCLPDTTAHERFAPRIWYEEWRERLRPEKMEEGK